MRLPDAAATCGYSDLAAVAACHIFLYSDISFSVNLCNLRVGRLPVDHSCRFLRIEDCGKLYHILLRVCIQRVGCRTDDCDALDS